jgi:hypothetical protein
MIYREGQSITIERQDLCSCEGCIFAEEIECPSETCVPMEGRDFHVIYAYKIEEDD